MPAGLCSRRMGTMPARPHGAAGHPCCQCAVRGRFPARHRKSPLGGMEGSAEAGGAAPTAAPPPSLFAGPFRRFRPVCTCALGLSWTGKIRGGLRHGINRCPSARPRAPFRPIRPHQHDLCQAVVGLDEMLIASFVNGRRPGGRARGMKNAGWTAGASAPPSYGPLRPRRCAGADRKKAGRPAHAASPAATLWHSHHGGPQLTSTSPIPSKPE